MDNTLYEAATNMDVPSVRQWKENGGKIVGYTCAFLPVEVFHAAGILPIRLRGIQAESMEIAAAYYGPFVCSFPKAILQLAGSGTYDFLDGVVISNGCDTMRRLDDCWRKMGKDIGGSAPGWFHYFDVPHKPDGHAFDWYVDQVKKLTTAIETTFEVSVTSEKLENAIREQNRIRTTLFELESLRRSEASKVFGADAYAAIVAGTVMPRDHYAHLLSDFVEEIRGREAGVCDGRKRLFLGGSVCDDIELVKLIEDSGAVVVGENICFGVRDAADRVAETGDPVVALTKKYLSGAACPRMMGWYKQRRGEIIQRVKDTGAHGVILQNIRFCDLHGSENGLLERDLEKEGIPSLRIEREYGPLTETGRLKMRIDAFLEQLGRG
jgi:benzoyl-CoA reductase subunit C